MSVYYAASNKETSIQLFEKRTVYKKIVKASSEYSNLVDFNFGEKFFYGRTSGLFVPITINKAFLGIKYFKSAATISAVNFVVDAFEDMAKQFNKCAMAGQIDPNDTYLSRLQVYKAWNEPSALYEAYLSTYYDSMAGAIKSKRIKIRDFDEFIKEFESLIMASAPRLPFTKPAFIKSRRCPINSSGLAVEIADLDASNDDEKIDEFVSSKNWEFYVNTCRSFGFMVDQFVPWRLVADIASTPMLEYAGKYNFKNTHQILNLGYGRVHNGYFKNFKYYLLNLYNRLRPKSFTESVECNGKTVTRRVKTQNYSIDQLSENYSDTYFLDLYFKIRFIEEESQFDDFEKEMLVDDCLEIHQSLGVSHALEIFERILNKPFDYRGSLSYIKEYVDIVSAEAT